MNGTRALTCKYNAQLSCGRVQTPTLAMIAKREEEIRKFVPKEYYGISLETQDVKWTWRDEKGNTRSFQKEKIEGIHRVSFYHSVIDLPNRYDFMILLEMERGALPVFDASDIHRDWKSKYGSLLSAKAIFDCD